MQDGAAWIPACAGMMGIFSINPPTNSIPRKTRFQGLLRFGADTEGA